MTKELSRTSELRQSLAEATTPDQAAAIGDMALGFADIMKKVGAARLDIIDAVVIGCEARRLAGEMLGEPPGQGIGGGRGKLLQRDNSLGPVQVCHFRAVRFKVGERIWPRYVDWITKHGTDEDDLTWTDNLILSRLNVMLQDAAIGLLETSKAKDLKDAIRIVKRREARAAVAAKTATVRLADATDWLWEIDEHSVDLLITDPPYSTEFESFEKFNAFVMAWLAGAARVLKPSGQGYIFIGAYPKELLLYLTLCNQIEENGDFRVQDVLVWTYRNTIGPKPTSSYIRNWQAILYLRGPDAPPLNCDTLKEQFAVMDFNAPDGRMGDKIHKWQKPDDLAEQLVNHGSSPGDYLIDPFCGSGAFLAAAARLGRISDGCDNDPKCIELCVTRGCKCVGSKTSVKATNAS